MTADLDEHVEQFRHRPLDAAGPFTFVAADALTMRLREGGRVINAVVLLATGVNGDGTARSSACASPPVRPVRCGTSSSPTSSPAADRRPAGHLRCPRRPVEAIAANLAGASWQRCRTPLRSQPHVGHTEGDVAGGQGDAALGLRPAGPAAVHAQFDRLLDYVNDKLPEVHDHLDGVRDDILAFTGFPKDVWTQIWSNNPPNASTARSDAAPTQSASPHPRRHRAPGRRRPG